MRIAIRTEFAHFQAALMNALILAREVIGMLALCAFQFNHVVLGHKISNIEWCHYTRLFVPCQHLDAWRPSGYNFHVLRRCSSVGRATPW